MTTCSSTYHRSQPVRFPRERQQVPDTDKVHPKNDPMSSFQSPFLCGVAMMIAVIQPSHADVEWKPLSLAQRGKFIELHRGEFVRASSVVEISGEIILSASPKVPRLGFQLASRSFPLSLDGIKELKNSDRTALIGDFGRVEDKVDDFKFELNVRIRVNGHLKHLLVMIGLESWDEIEKKLKAAVGDLHKLLVLASGSGGDGADESLTAPEADGK